VQKHQFLNKIHTIAGLLELKEYDEALDLIQLEARVQQKEIQFISDNIKQTEVAGLILGKMGRCKELGIRFILNETSFLGSVSEMDTNSIVVCLGNIIENSIEAILSSDKKEREVQLLIKQTNKEMVIKVEDTGIGIVSSTTDILTKGFTTKKGGKRGYGLFIVKSTLDSLKGTINIDSRIGKGTTIILRIPEGQHYGY
jgi:sensor histidine kinase regulating citrate/malate metabolism